MKTALFALVTLTAFSSFASADQFCGKLNGYCGNGWCNRTITPTYCLGAIKPGPHPEYPTTGSNCADGAAVKVVAENPEALNQLNNLLERGEGTRVCAEGSRDDAGVFHVASATEEN